MLWRGSTSLLDAITQEIIEIRRVVNHVARDIDIVFDSMERQLSIFLNHVTRARVTVAGLSHRADVDHKFCICDFVNKVHLFRRDEITAFGKHARHVGVALETGMRYQTEEFFHLLLIVDIFGENVFVHRIARRAVNIEPFTIAVQTWQCAEEVPTFVGPIARALGVFQLITGPEDCLLGTAVEPFGIEHCRLVVVAQQSDFAVVDNVVKTFAWLGTITDDIAETKDLVNVLRLDMRKHCLERFEIAVDVA